MKILGITAEYNPFHIGHMKNIAAAKKAAGCDYTIIVMSGNFVQRGEPAICDKWRRTEMALRGGADLVIELPVRFSTAGAGYFARGAVTLFEMCGIVDCICFGSEWADICALRKCAVALFDENVEFKKKLRDYLNQGMSFPSARAGAAREILPDTPNNILGVEYIMALLELKSKIVPFTVTRADISAKDVREAVKKSRDISMYLPPASAALLDEAKKNYGLADYDNLSTIVRHLLFTKKYGSFDVSDISEGLENRLIESAKINGLISDIVSNSKTKRYTYLRLQRAVCHLILNITKKDMEITPQYIRVLGFKEPKLLKMLNEKAKLPVMININKAELPLSGMKMLEQEIYASEIYSLACNKTTFFNEHTMSVVKV